MQVNDDAAIEEDDVDLDHLRRMLKDIIYWFCADKEKMRRTRNTLLNLFDEFSKESLQRYEAERITRKRKVKGSRN